MSYLHLASQGYFWKQVYHDPTEEELLDVKDGYLDILRYSKGKFQKVTPDGKWEEVAPVPADWTEDKRLDRE